MRITGIHSAYPAYGAERVTRELERQGFEVGRHRVVRLMRQCGLAGITRRKRRNPAKPDPAAAAVADLLRREFTAPMPRVTLIGDISCFPAGEGRLYLATVLNLCSKELTGSCLDGAAAESFFATVKSEIGVTFWPDRASVRRDIENWIKTYNERRLHSTIGYRIPTEMRRAR